MIKHSNLLLYKVICIK